LVIDDEPDILLLLRIVLEEEGHDTLLAADGVSAVERLEREDVDLVLLDVCMPVMDGWRVLEIIRARPAAPPVVVISGRSLPGDHRRAEELGAVDYVRKPFDPGELVARVEAALETR
jgi:DNA-binding response OmpR family regulator